MSNRMNLVCPEWQGGRCPDVHRGALWLAEAVFAGRGYVTIDAPPAQLGEVESTAVVDGVYALPVLAARYARTLEVLSRARPERMLTLSGTCAGEAAPITWLNPPHAGQLALPPVDAHGLLTTPQTSPSGDFHGMVLRTLLGEGPAQYVDRLKRPLRHEQVFLIGARDLDPAEGDYLAAQPLHVYPQLTPANVDRLLADLAASGYSHIYVHLDVDVLDPGKFAETPLRAPGGPDTAALLACLRAVAAAYPVAGVGVCEYRGTTHASRTQLHALLADSGLLPLF